jgi:hypothetical protein
MIRDTETFKETGDTIYWLENDPGDKSNACTRRNSITEEEADILREDFRDLVVCEIGTGTGFSAEVMSKTATVVTVDIDSFVHEVVFPNLRRMGVVCLRTLPDGLFDAVFIDGGHSFEQVMKDLGWAKAHLTCGGFIVCHDLHLPVTGKAIRLWAIKNKWIVKPYDTRQGLCRLDPE